MTPSQRIGRWLTETGRWAPGMRLVDPSDGERYVVLAVESPGWHVYSLDDGRVRSYTFGSLRIDMDAGPTRGALEDILLEAWPFAVVFYLEGREPARSYAVQEYHTIDALNPGHDVRGVSRGAAVAAALIVAHEIPEYR